MDLVTGFSEQGIPRLNVYGHLLVAVHSCEIKELLTREKILSRSELKIKEGEMIDFEEAQNLNFPRRLMSLQSLISPGLATALQLHCIFSGAVGGLFVNYLRNAKMSDEHCD